MNLKGCFLIAVIVVTWDVSHQDPKHCVIKHGIDEYTGERWTRKNCWIDKHMWKTFTSREKAAIFLNRMPQANIPMFRNDLKRANDFHFLAFSRDGYFLQNVKVVVDGKTIYDESTDVSVIINEPKGDSK